MIAFHDFLIFDTQISDVAWKADVRTLLNASQGVNPVKYQIGADDATDLKKDNIKFSNITCMIFNFTEVINCMFTAVCQIISNKHTKPELLFYKHHEDATLMKPKIFN